MALQNKNTWFHAVKAGQEDAFHRSYEAAFEALRKSPGLALSNFVNGAPRASKGKLLRKTAPWDSEVLVATFPDSTIEEAKEAIAIAKAASASWRKTSFEDRAALLDRSADVMARRFFELCATMTLECGKSRFEASIDVDEAIDFARHYAAEVRAHRGFVSAMGSPFPGEFNETRMVPYGVFGVISPFNFPVAITAGMVLGALVTGNTVVLKPTVDAPLSAEMVLRCIIEAGAPAGVLNLVHGAGSTVGQTLVDSPDVDGFVFTGSKNVGLNILRTAQKDHAKPVIAEMGGKNPIIVTAKADLDAAAEGVFNAAFGFSGQKCSACSRLYLDKSIKAEFLNRFMMRVTSAIVGHPADRTTYMGPIINERAMKTYLDAAELARRDGEILFGGERLTGPGYDRGNFVLPTVVDKLPATHELFQRELFVPFLVINTFDSLDEAIAKANRVEFGLTAGIFTKDKAEADRFFDHVEAGVTYCNRRRGGSTGAVVDAQTFVGWKNSGTTGRGAGGRNYLQQFMKEQSRTIVRE